MSDYDTRLIEYDLASEAERPALLATFFDDPELEKTFEHIANDRITRAIVEFNLLDVIPYEDYVLLKTEGYIDCREEFCTYVPVARGLFLPDVRLTTKGQDFDVINIVDRYTEDLFDGLIFAYRARNMGMGLVAGRETLEEWVEKGDQANLSALVHPFNGETLSDWSSDHNILLELGDPEKYAELIALRATIRVADPFTASILIHSPNGTISDHCIEDD